MKLKTIKMYDLNDVPEHIAEEVKFAAIKLGIAIHNVCKDLSPNIVFGAMNYMHAAMIKQLVSDKEESQKEAAKNAAVGIIKNVYFLNGFEDEKN